MSSTTEPRAELNRALQDLAARADTAVAALGPDGLAGARWSGLARADVDHVSIRDAFPLGTGGGVVVLSVSRHDGAPVLLTLPLDDPATWTGLHQLAIVGGTVVGTHGGQLEGRPGPASNPPSVDRAGARSTQGVRPIPGDQSHTSMVLGEESIVKLYRRLTAGPNLEAETLRALAGRPGAPVPDWHGSVDVTLSDGDVTSIAIDQAFIHDAADAFEVVADGLAVWLAGGSETMATAILHDIGSATGRLHRDLAQSGDSGLAPRPATPGDRAAWVGAALSTLERAISAVGAIDGREAVRLERVRPSIGRILDGLMTSSGATMLQRIHGDLHLGQVLPTPDRVVIIDFEGDPTRDPEDRRSMSSPLRDIAGMLRSIDHVARSGLRRARLPGGTPGNAGSGALEEWIEAARAAFMTGYGTGLEDPEWRPDPGLLRAFELDKELAEFIYAAAYLPTWIYAPMGGIRALLGKDFEALA